MKTTPNIPMVEETKRWLLKAFEESASSKDSPRGGARPIRKASATPKKKQQPGITPKEKRLII